MAEDTPTPAVLTATPDAVDALIAPEELRATKGAEELVSLVQDSPTPAPIEDIPAVRDAEVTTAEPDVEADLPVETPDAPFAPGDVDASSQEELGSADVDQGDTPDLGHTGDQEELPAPQMRAAFAVSEALSGESAVPDEALDEAVEPAEVVEDTVEKKGARKPEPVAPPPVENKKKWYVVKCQPNREDTIKEAIERRVKKEGLEEFYGQIVIPVEKYSEVKVDKNGRKVTKTKERKLYPGYLFTEVEYNDRVLYLFRETTGVGDFVGMHPTDRDRPPTPMSDVEVLRMIGPGPGEKKDAAVVAPAPIGLSVGDRVRIVDGTFNGMEGIVKSIKEATGKLEVEVSIIGRLTQIELDFYQVEEM